jgi:hypothetical protein
VVSEDDGFMATAEHLREVALSLPEATEKPMHGTPAFYVKAKFFARLNNDGRTAVMHVADLHEKDALLAAEPVKLTTTPHYDGHASVLVVLAKVTKVELREFVTDSWRLRAPKRLVAAFDSRQH